MAKRVKETAMSGQRPNSRAAEQLVELPAHRDGLLAASVAAVVEIDSGIMRGDRAAAELGSARYQAIVRQLNGGTTLGCMADEDAAGRRVERHCAAVPGCVPLWGQRGQFLAMLNGMRALVEFEAGYGGPLRAHFQFHAIDLDLPFISETGYRSYFDTARFGKTVDEAARVILASMLGERKRPVMLQPSYRDRLAHQPLPAWLAGLTPPARRQPATMTVPDGFVLVDVVLPAHQAFIAKRWAAVAACKVKAANASSSAAKAPPRTASLKPAWPRAAKICSTSDAEGHSEAPNGIPDVRGPTIVSTPCTRDVEFKQGQRCEIVSVHHPVFNHYIGRRIIITKVCPESHQVWAHDDRPVAYKMNRQGRQVIDSDPRSIQSVYDFDEVQPVPPTE